MHRHIEITPDGRRILRLGPVPARPVTLHAPLAPRKGSPECR